MYTLDHLIKKGIDIDNDILLNVRLDYYDTKKEYFEKVYKEAKNIEKSYDMLNFVDKDELDLNYDLYKNKLLLNETIVAKYLFFDVKRRIFTKLITELEVLKIIS